MIYYNSWLSNDAHSKAVQAQHNEGRAASYFEALEPLRAALGIALSPLRQAAEAWRRRRLLKAGIRELSALDDHMLKDLGISRGQIPSVVLKASLEAQPTTTSRPSFKPAVSNPARRRTAAETECQIIPLVRPDSPREIQHTPRGRRHRYPLPLNAA